MDWTTNCYKKKKSVRDDTTPSFATDILERSNFRDCVGHTSKTEMFSTISITSLDNDDHRYNLTINTLNPLDYDCSYCSY